MDSATPFPFAGRTTDPLELDLAEVDTAIEFVRRGIATRVRLANLRRPSALASTALARAQAAGVDFSIDGNGEPSVLTFGSPD